MPVRDLPLNPKIKVVFKGLVISSIRDEERSALIGAHGNSLCHKPRVQVIRTPENGNGPPEYLHGQVHQHGNFSLTVENTRNPLIQVFRKADGAINRFDNQNDPRDFRWFVDFDEVHGGDIVIEGANLQPTFTINKGVFQSSNLSDNEVRITRYGQASVPFGRYANEITARVVFDQQNTIASFKIDGDDVIPLIEAQDGYRYEITFDCDCQDDSGESDFGKVYDVIRKRENGQNRPLYERERIRLTVGSLLLEETDGAKIALVRNPEVYCTGGNNGGGG